MKIFAVNGVEKLQIIGIVVGIALLYSLGAKIHAFQCKGAAIFDLPLLVPSLWFYSVGTCPIKLPDPENIGIAVGIALLSSLGTEIRWGSIGPPWQFS